MSVSRTRSKSSKRATENKKVEEEHGQKVQNQATDPVVVANDKKIKKTDIQTSQDIWDVGAVYNNDKMMPKKSIVTYSKRKYKARPELGSLLTTIHTKGKANKQNETKDGVGSSSLSSEKLISDLQARTATTNENDIDSPAPVIGEVSDAPQADTVERNDTCQESEADEKKKNVKNIKADQEHSDQIDTISNIRTRSSSSTGKQKAPAEKRTNPTKKSLSISRTRKEKELLMQQQNDVLNRLVTAEAMEDSEKVADETETLQNEKLVHVDDRKDDANFETKHDAHFGTKDDGHSDSKHHAHTTIQQLDHPMKNHDAYLEANQTDHQEEKNNNNELIQEHAHQDKTLHFDNLQASLDLLNLSPIGNANFEGRIHGRRIVSSTPSGPRTQQHIQVSKPLKSFSESMKTADIEMTEGFVDLDEEMPHHVETFIVADKVRSTVQMPPEPASVHYHTQVENDLRLEFMHETNNLLAPASATDPVFIPRTTKHKVNLEQHRKAIEASIAEPSMHDLSNAQIWSPPRSPSIEVARRQSQQSGSQHNIPEGLFEWFGNNIVSQAVDTEPDCNVDEELEQFLTPEQLNMTVEQFMRSIYEEKIDQIRKEGQQRIDRLSEELGRVRDKLLAELDCDS